MVYTSSQQFFVRLLLQALLILLKHSIGELDLLLTKPVDTQFYIVKTQSHSLSSRIPYVWPCLVYPTFLSHHFRQHSCVRVWILGVVGMYALYYILATTSLARKYLEFEKSFSMLEVKQPFIYQGHFVWLYIIPVAGIGAIPTLIISPHFPLSFFCNSNHKFLFFLEYF